MLFPQAALHHTISSVSGSKAVKHIGQSPETSLRFEGDDGEVVDDVGGGGALEKISWSSFTLCWTRERLRRIRYFATNRREESKLILKTGAHFEDIAKNLGLKS